MTPKLICDLWTGEYEADFSKQFVRPFDDYVTGMQNIEAGCRSEYAPKAVERLQDHVLDVLSRTTLGCAEGTAAGGFLVLNRLHEALSEHGHEEKEGNQEGNRIQGTPKGSTTLCTNIEYEA
jgi:hypothetical protein